MIDGTKAIFSTRFNFQKIIAEGTVTLSILNVASSFTEYTIYTHGLGYIPTVRLFYIPVSGQLWPMSPNQYLAIGGGSGTSLEVYGNPVLSTNDLKVRVVNSGSTQDVTFYYRIYADE